MASSSGLPWYTNDPEQPVRAVDLEVGAADGELLAVGRMMDEAVAPADPEIELVDHQLEVAWTHQRTDVRPRCGAGRPAAVVPSRRSGALSLAHRPVLGSTAVDRPRRGGRRSRPSRPTSAGSACGYS